MTELHVWATTRYNLEPLKAIINQNPHLGNQQIRKVVCHRRKPLNTGIFFNIHQTSIIQKKVRKIHLILFDDLDYAKGCQDWVLIRIIKSLIALAKNNKKIFVACSDFLNKIEFGLREDQDIIRKLKKKLDHLSDKFQNQFYYFDHEDQVDFTQYTDESPISEKDLKKVVSQLIDDVEDLPDEC